MFHVILFRVAPGVALKLLEASALAGHRQLIAFFAFGRAGSCVEEIHQMIERHTFPAFVVAEAGDRIPADVRILHCTDGCEAD